MERLSDIDKSMLKVQILANIIKSFWDENEGLDYYDMIDPCLDQGYFGRDDEFIEISPAEACWYEESGPESSECAKHSRINPDCNFIITSSLYKVLGKEYCWDDEDGQLSGDDDLEEEMQEMKDILGWE